MSDVYILGWCLSFLSGEAILVQQKVFEFGNSWQAGSIFSHEVLLQRLSQKLLSAGTAAFRTQEELAIATSAPMHRDDGQESNQQRPLL